MAREVVLVEWCDVCLADASHTEAHWTSVIRIGDVERELMLCEPHFEQLIGELPLVLEKVGTRVEVPAPHTRKRREPGEPKQKKNSARDCPICGTTRSSGPTIAVHIFRDHLGGSRPVAPTNCPDCDWVPKPDAKNRMSAIGKHRQVMHGFDPIAEAMAAYDAAQHPYDVPVTRKPEMLSQVEAAQRAGVNKDVIHGCVRRGTLASTHTEDGHVRISSADLEEWVASRHLVD